MLPASPFNRNAYLPFSSDSLPEPAPQAKTPLEVFRLTLALADAVGSSTDVAETVTNGKAGAVAGGVYVAGTPFAVFAGLIVPQPGEQAAPF
jgi:hypothetical protein